MQIFNRQTNVRILFCFRFTCKASPTNLAMFFFFILEISKPIETNVPYKSIPNESDILVSSFCCSNIYIIQFINVFQSLFLLYIKNCIILFTFLLKNKYLDRFKYFSNVFFSPILCNSIIVLSMVLLLVKKISY